MDGTEEGNEILKHASLYLGNYEKLIELPGIEGYSVQSLLRATPYYYPMLANKLEDDSCLVFIDFHFAGSPYLAIQHIFPTEEITMQFFARLIPINSRFQRLYAQFHYQNPKV